MIDIVEVVDDVIEDVVLIAEKVCTGPFVIVDSLPGDNGKEDVRRS